MTSRTLDTLPFEILCCIAEQLQSSYTATLAFSLTCHTTRTAVHKIRRAHPKPLEYNITDLLEIERWSHYCDPEGFSSWPDADSNLAISSTTTCNGFGGSRDSSVVSAPPRFMDKSERVPLTKGFLPAIYFEHCLPYRHQPQQLSWKPGRLRSPKTCERFACSLCLRIRPACKFSPTMTDGSRGKDAVSAPDKDDRAYRFCIECGMKYGDYWVSDLFNIRWLPMCMHRGKELPVRKTMVV